MRLVKVLVFGPVISFVSYLLFMLGKSLSPRGLAEPVTSAGLQDWLRYGFDVAITPIVYAIIILFFLTLFAAFQGGSSGFTIVQTGKGIFEVFEGTSSGVSLEGMGYCCGCLSPLFGGLPFGLLYGMVGYYYQDLQNLYMTLAIPFPVPFGTLHNWMTLILMTLLVWLIGLIGMLVFGHSTTSDSG